MSEHQEKGEATTQFVVLYRNGIRVLIEIDTEKKDEAVAQWQEARRKHLKEGRSVSVWYEDVELTPGDVVLFAPFSEVFFPELDDGGLDDEDGGDDEDFGDPIPGGGLKIRKTQPVKEPVASKPAFVGPDPSAV